MTEQRCVLHRGSLVLLVLALEQRHEFAHHIRVRILIALIRVPDGAQCKTGAASSAAGAVWVRVCAGWLLAAHFAFRSHRSPLSNLGMPKGACGMMTALCAVCGVRMRQAALGWARMKEQRHARVRATAPHALVPNQGGSSSYCARTRGPARARVRPARTQEHTRTRARLAWRHSKRTMGSGSPWRASRNLRCSSLLSFM
jgi:hypothetical protein